jgi:phospholipid transport system substrate-binding protein
MRAVRAGILLVSLLAASFLSSPSPALSTGGPTEQLRFTIDNVIDILRDETLQGPGKFDEKVDAIRKVVYAHFDFEEMSKRSLARHWRDRTPKEREEFITLYRELLEKVYVKQLEKYVDETVEYLDEKIRGKYAIVKTKLVMRKTDEVPIDFRLRKNKTKWLTYDIVVGGVSIISNYRSQFNEILRSGSYGDLLQRLKAKLEEE